MLRITPKQLKFIAQCYRMSVTAATFFVILYIGILLEKTLLAILAIISISVSKKFLTDNYHCKSLIHCFCVSCIVFIVLLRVIPSVNFSVASAPVLAALVAYASCYVTRYTKYEKFYSSNNSFNIDNPTEQEIRDRCKFRKFTHDETEICVKLFCKQGTKKLSAKEYMSLVGASDEWTARNIKAAYKKRLV